MAHPVQRPQGRLIVGSLAQQAQPELLERQEFKVQQVFRSTEPSENRTNGHDGNYWLMAHGPTASTGSTGTVGSNGPTGSTGATGRVQVQQDPVRQEPSDKLTNR
jgi:hypothetical protein